MNKSIILIAFFLVVCSSCERTREYTCECIDAPHGASLIESYKVDAKDWTDADNTCAEKQLKLEAIPIYAGTICSISN